MIYSTLTQDMTGGDLVFELLKPNHYFVIREDIVIEIIGPAGYSSVVNIGAKSVLDFQGGSLTVINVTSLGGYAADDFTPAKLCGK